MAKTDKDNLARKKQIGILTTIPAVLLAGPLVGFLVGKTLDKWFSTEPWFLVIFLFLGLASSGKEVYRLIRLAERESEDGDSDKEQPGSGQ